MGIMFLEGVSDSLPSEGAAALGSSLVPGFADGGFGWYSRGVGRDALGVA